MMPEGPEVRTISDQLRPRCLHSRLIDLRFVSGRYVRGSRPKGFEDFAQTMTSIYQGKKKEKKRRDVVVEWGCKGKFMYFVLDGDNDVVLKDDDYQRSIWITLGMTGRFDIEEDPTQNDEVDDGDGRSIRWYLDFYNYELERVTRVKYYDMRNFGTLRFSLSSKELKKKLDTLGYDILDVENTTEDVFMEVVDRQRNQEMNICKFLMDQSKISGIGNYLLSEGLYLSLIDPFTSTLSSLTKFQKTTLFHNLQTTALRSYQANGVTRTDGGSYRDADGNRGQFQFQLKCYGRELDDMGRRVRKETNGPHGRSIWFVDDQLDQTMGGLGQKQNEATAPATVTSTPTPTTQDDVVGVKEASRLANYITDPSWKQALHSYTSTSPRFRSLAKFLSTERSTTNSNIYPPPQLTFAALNHCPISKIKVVIVGQDPYHGPGQGHGLAFSVRKGVPPPPSLKNILKEMHDDIGNEVDDHGNLEGWCHQGVLLLNTILTVRRGEANSHSKKGWEEFTDEVIRIIVDEKQKENGGVVFLLWGNPAAKKISNVDMLQSLSFEEMGNGHRIVIIRTSHPSPLGATKTSRPFLGSKCFSRTNHALTEMGLDPIDWIAR